MSFQSLSRFVYLLTFALWLVAPNAWAWVEHTFLSHEARVEIVGSGVAKVSHKAKLRVRGGPLRHVDIPISDKEVTLSGEASIVQLGEAMGAQIPIPLAVAQRPDGPLRVDINGGDGIRRGLYEVAVTYEVDLLRQGQVRRDGGLLNVSWAGPKWDDGMDGVKTTFAVAASLTEPRVAGQVEVQGPNNETVTVPTGAMLSSLERFPQYDELSLVRPYVAAGEVVRWSIQVDPTVLGEVRDPRVQVPKPSIAARMQAPERALHLAVGVGIALVYSLLLAAKHREVALGCAIRKATPRALVPVGAAIRSAFAGPLLAASVGAQLLLAHPLPGTLGVMAVVLLTVYRAPTFKSAPRGPGRWLPLSDKDAFKKGEPWPRGWLDASTGYGKAVLVVATAAFGAGVWWVARQSFYFAYLVGLDYVVVVVLLGTGRRVQLPAHGFYSSAQWLAPLAKRLRRCRDLVGVRVRGLARFPAGQPGADELRLSVYPRSTMHGFRGMEVALGWAHGQGGPVALPQSLVRVTEGSPCHEALLAQVRRAKWMHGRDTTERVMVVSPVVPDVDTVAKLTQRLCGLCQQPAPSSEKVKAPAARKSRTPASTMPVGLAGPAGPAGTSRVSRAAQTARAARQRAATLLDHLTPAPPCASAAGPAGK